MGAVRVRRSYLHGAARVGGSPRGLRAVPRGNRNLEAQPAPARCLETAQAAAAIVLAAGISIGRATAPKVDADKLRLAITPEIRRDLSRELTQLVREEAARTASISLATGRTYTDQTAQQIYMLLKQDVDTLA